LLPLSWIDHDVHVRDVNVRDVRDVRDLRLRELLVNVPVNALCGYRMWHGSG